MNKNQIISTIYAVTELNYKLSIAKSLNGSKQLLDELRRDIRTQTDCLDYLMSSQQETFVNLNKNLIYAY